MQFFYGASVGSGALASSSLVPDYTGLTLPQVCAGHKIGACTCCVYVCSNSNISNLPTAALWLRYCPIYRL